MTAGEKMGGRFIKLISEGNAFREDFLNSYRYRWYRYSAHNAGYAVWKQEVLRLLKESFGERSRYYTELAAMDSDLAPKAPGAVFSFFLGTLKKAERDFRKEAAAPPEPRVPGLMDKLLFRAEGLARKGHFVSAVTLAGTVLEDLLRRLCERRGVFCPGNSALENVNDRLLEAGVFNAVLHREAAQCMGLRKAAQFCYTEKINGLNAMEMICWLRALISREPAAGLAAGFAAARPAPERVP